MDPGIERWKCKSDKPLAGFTEFAGKLEKTIPYHFGRVNFQNGMDKRHADERNSSMRSGNKNG